MSSKRHHRNVFGSGAAIRTPEAAQKALEQHYDLPRDQQDRILFELRQALRTEESYRTLIRIAETSEAYSLATRAVRLPKAAFAPGASVIFNGERHDLAQTWAAFEHHVGEARKLARLFTAMVRREGRSGQQRLDLAMIAMALPPILRANGVPTCPAKMMGLFAIACGVKGAPTGDRITLNRRWHTISERAKALHEKHEASITRVLGPTPPRPHAPQPETSPAAPGQEPSVGNAAKDSGD